MAPPGRLVAGTCVFLILFSTIHADKCEGSESISDGENCRGTETNLITTHDMKTIQKRDLSLRLLPLRKYIHFWILLIVLLTISICTEQAKET